MHFKVSIAAWLLAILFISQTICEDNDDKKEKKSEDGPASSGNRATGMGTNMTLNMNGMPGIQLPFPFFPPFGCDATCQPMQFQIFQQQVPQPVMTTQPTATRPPTTTPPPPPKPTTEAQRPPPPQTTPAYTMQTVVMNPNWCQGWCRFFYQPPPQPVYYQPNCLLFSWMGMGPGMQAMGMQTTRP